MIFPICEYVGLTSSLHFRDQQVLVTHASGSSLAAIDMIFPICEHVWLTLSLYFRDQQVLVTHASGLALTAMIAASDDPRGPKVYVDSASGKEGMTLTLNLTTFLLVTG